MTESDYAATQLPSKRLNDNDPMHSVLIQTARFYATITEAKLREEVEGEGACVMDDIHMLARAVLASLSPTKD